MSLAQQTASSSLRMRIYVGRKGEVNAWENQDFAKTVRATGKKTLIRLGVWRSVRHVPGARRKGVASEGLRAIEKQGKS